MKESDLQYERGGHVAGGVTFELGSLGASAGSLQAHQERLLHPEKNEEPDLSDDSSDEVDGRDWPFIRFRFLRFIAAVTICVVLALFVAVVVGLKINWGDAAYDKRLILIMNKFSRAGWRLTSTCLYKQFNNGAPSSGMDQLGMIEQQWDGLNRSADILFYHHQGNIIEITGPPVANNGIGPNATRWLQISFNRHGLFWRYSPLPRLFDIIRYTKECYWKCATIPHRNGDPQRFAQWLFSMRNRHYNGFLMNCLQYSHLMWEQFDPQDIGCAPKEFVNDVLVTLPSFPHKSAELVDSDGDDDGDDKEHTGQ